MRANSFRVAVCTAFFFTFHAAPLPKMHEFRATLAEHALSCAGICVKQKQFDVKFKLHQVL